MATYRPGRRPSSPSPPVSSNHSETEPEVTRHSSSSSIAFAKQPQLSSSQQSFLAEKKRKEPPPPVDPGLPPTKHTRTKFLPWTTILPYCAPCIGAGGMTFTLTTFTAYFYTDTLGLSPAAVGAVEICLMLMYACSEPIFGWLSDITRGPIAQRFGRRKPYLAVSCVIHAAAFYCLVGPPTFLSQTPAGLKTWAFCFAALLGLSWGCNEVVFQGLGSQLTFDYDERTKLQAVVVGLITTGSTFCGLIHGLLGEAYGSEGIENRMRFRVIGIVFAGMFLIGNLILLVCVHEEVLLDTTLAPRRDATFVEWIREGWHSMKEMITNVPFNSLLIMYSLALTTGAITPMLLPYFSKHIVQSQICMDWAPLMFTGASVIGIPLWVLLGGYNVGLEKKWRFTIAMCWLAVFLVLSASVVQKGDTVLMVVFSVFSGLAFGGYFAVPEAMKPDVVDYDEFRTGARHEARLAGVWMFGANTMAGIGLQVVLAILHEMGYDGSKPAGEQPAKALLTIRVGYGSTICILGVLMFVALLFYPITRAKHEQIIQATNTRLSGGYAVDPLYGGEPLPPYEGRPLIEAAQPTPPEKTMGQVPFLQQVEQQVGPLSQLHGGRDTIRYIP